MDAALARRLWTVAETYHAVTYFSPRVTEAWEAAGVTGFWRGYFAGRAAPLGAAPAAVVTATFHNFHPAMVARAVPDIWGRITPADAVATRVAGAVAALDDVLGPVGEAEVEAAVLARRAAEGATGEGRALFAANAALPWPEGVRAELWHAATLLREHRGDGHVAALLAADVDGCEAQVLAVAAGSVTAERMRLVRGWSEDDWAAAAGRLADRGLVEPVGETLTAAGRDLRAGVEAATDRAATRALAPLGTDGAEHLVRLLAGPATAIARSGVVPYPNPIGLRSTGAGPAT